MNGKKVSEYLLGELLPFAKKMLLDHGEFHPFGGWVDRDGKMTHMGAKISSTSRPKSIDLIRMLRTELKEKAGTGQIQAAGIVFDVYVFVPKLGEKSDAIQINLDHSDGYSAEVFLPYHMESDHLPIFGEMFAQAGESEIFVNNGNQLH